MIVAVKKNGRKLLHFELDLNPGLRDVAMHTASSHGTFWVHLKNPSISAAHKYDVSCISVIV